MESSVLWKAAVLGVIGHFLIRTIYRLYFHPLHKFPGPKLAAATHCYEFYYDAIKRGRFIWEIQRMHEKYGPIVRINPRELHIMDPYFFDEIYGSRKTEKDAAFVPIFTLPDATVATVGHDHHRYRRGILNNFFSKRSVSKLEGLIHEKTEKACQHLEEACKNGTIVSMDALSAALTADVISHYAYGRSSGILDDKSLKNDFRDAINGIADIAHYTRFFPVLVTLLNAIPPSIIRKLQPKARGMLDAKEMLWKRSVAALEDSRLGRRSKETGSTIFDTLSDTSVVPEERTLARLRDEGLSLLAAGTETTSRVLAVASFHLLSDKTMWLRLREELKQVMPTPTSTATWAQLEQLPYLTAVVNESLRLSHSSTIRLPRVFPSESLVYKDWVIPPGTPVSQGLYFVHTNPSIFPDPEAFYPNRWIRATENGERLTRFLVPFAKGTRICLGMNLAYAEIYLALAAFVRRFDLELYDTTYEDDIRITRDLIIGLPDKESVQVKAKVTAIVRD